LVPTNEITLTERKFWLHPIPLILYSFLRFETVIHSNKPGTSVLGLKLSKSLGMTTISSVPLMASSPFCVSVLYLYRAHSRSVENEMPTAYCVKCKTSIEIKNPQNVTLKNGKPAVKGVCPNCGTSVFRIGKA